ncbi:hypothetical protein SERLADRAFT_382596 [Serpula lacrymans var. lacrymans S7.9]|uniref:Uncharacterized protein n=1 Tax=Serpula lacrymans var. lacrymans (strain S7.9) TaxID=578457 RepID=F8NNA2_SERL9|nr:uncharacterized protein SERLADRAFT_382596 [Serpula lacrymans var. lacrymans S7.9]EGO27532.1 hypothetical protein SERLADRAFT_382596 [Serpula lacrymans var. lacrymans S7.9]
MRLELMDKLCQSTFGNEIRHLGKDPAHKEYKALHEQQTRCSCHRRQDDEPKPSIDSDLTLDKSSQL